MTDTSTIEATPRVGRARRTGFTLVAALAAALTAILTIGALGLLIGDTTPDGVTLSPDGRLAVLVHVPWLGLGWCAAFVGMLWSASRRIAAFQQAVAMAIGMYVTGLLGRENDPIFYLGFGCVLLLLALLHPARGAVWRPGPAGMSPILVPFALLLAAPLTIYAVRMVGLHQSAGPGGPLYLSIANTALAVPLVALAAGLRAPGSRIPLWMAGAMLAVLSAAGSAAVPSPPAASPDVPWSYLGLLAAVAFVTVGEWELSRTRTRASAEPGGVVNERPPRPRRLGAR